MTTPKLQTEPLNTSRHDRAAFSCGIKELDEFLQKRANQERKKGYSVCYVLTWDNDDRTILGYYTLSAYSINLVDLPEAIIQALPRYPEVPVILLGRLATDQKFRGKRFGEYLLMDALQRCIDLAQEQIGAYAVVVDAKDENSAAFYAAYDFTPFPSTPLRLFMPVEQAKQALD